MDTSSLTGFKTFPIYNADGSPFHDLVLRRGVVDSIVMSLGDKITGEVYYPNNSLQVTMKEYIKYNGIHYYLINPPTVVREGIVSDNSELHGMTKYSFEFYHPMYMLSNFPFTDVATKSGEEKYLSQNKSFSWIGKPQDYIDKLNKNLQGTQWHVRKSSKFPQDKDNELSEVLTFDNVTIADAIKTGYETWDIPYVVSEVSESDPLYAQDKRFVVEYGLPSNEIYASESDRQTDTPYVFRFGQGVGLKNNSRTPRNNKIVTRIAGYGSEDNVPYGYPQIRWYGNQDWDYTKNNDPNDPLSYPIYKGIVGGQYVKLIKHPFTRTHLMPSIYSQTVFNKVSPYLEDGTANPDYNPNTTIIDYYDAIATQEYQYTNEINPQSPSYESHEFADIKPELDADRDTGIVSAVPLNADLTPADHWDDSMDDDGNYLQSYFQITLPQLSFDLYACAAITQEMQINMRSGACIGCTFPIQVDWDDYKRNFYDEDGNFVPDGDQRDLAKYPKSNLGQINIIVQKDNSTFGTLMPNIYQQPKAEDLFVFIGISLPTSYITNAEVRLDAAMKSYMLENNVYYFDYPLKFDEDFLTKHEYILSQIRPNSIIRFEYGGQKLQLFVKQLTVKYNNTPLPQFDITLTDNVEVVLNQIGQVADDVEKLSSLIAILRQSYNRNVWIELAKKLSKVSDDTAQGFIRFVKGLQVGNQFVSGILGEGGVFRRDADGKTYIEADKMYIRMKAYFDSVEIREYQHTSGNRIASQAKGFTASRVEWLDADGNITDNINDVVKFRCYWRAKDDEHEVQNQFVVGDQAFMEYSDIVDGDLIQKRFWRVVTGRNVSVTEDGEAWIDLSNKATDTITYTDHQGVSRTKTVQGYEEGSDIPQPEDDICQLGNVWDTSRQGAIIEFVSGEDAPSYQIFQGIDSFSLDDRNYIALGYSSLTGNAYINVYGDAYIGDKAGEGGYMRFNQQKRLLEIKGRLNVGSTLSDGRDVNALGVNRGNLLLNTSFTGDYDSEEVGSDTLVDSDTVMYSDPLRHWTANNVTIIPFSQSSSKYAATIATGGSLAQSVTLEKGKWYVLSFRGIGRSVGYTIGGVSGTLQMKETLDTYDVPFVCGDSESGLTITASTEVTLMELRLNEGNLPMSWGQNYNDGNRVMAAVNAYKYISDAIRNASTDIIGGLVLSQIIKVGNYRDKVMTEETGGMSGAYLDDNSPFLWGGGDIADAIYTIMKYADNPSYEATEEEISKMAHFVVTHGGRAILNDVILRGYIYALGGYFKGKITAESGEITGDVIVGDKDKAYFVISPSNQYDSAIKAFVKQNGVERLMFRIDFGYEQGFGYFPKIRVEKGNNVYSQIYGGGVETRSGDYGASNLSGNGLTTQQFEGSCFARFGFDEGKLSLFAVKLNDGEPQQQIHAWKTSSDNPVIGEVYVDAEGFLKVKIR